MKQNNYYSNNFNQKLNKIKQLLIKKYQIYDNWLLEQLALSLLKNGIDIDKFNNPYQVIELDLDEIVTHLKNKIIEERNQKINDTKTEKVKKKIKNLSNRK